MKIVRFFLEFEATDFILAVLCRLLLKTYKCNLLHGFDIKNAFLKLCFFNDSYPDNYIFRTVQNCSNKNCLTVSMLIQLSMCKFYQLLLMLFLTMRLSSALLLLLMPPVLLLSSSALLLLSNPFPSMTVKTIFEQKISC